MIEWMELMTDSNFHEGGPVDAGDLEWCQTVVQKRLMKEQSSDEEIII